MGFHVSHKNTKTRNGGEVSMFKKLLPVGEVGHEVNSPTVTTLLVICFISIGLMSIFCRTYSILRFGSLVHEYDPQFNYKLATILSEKGFFTFWNWFDHYSWYPLGRLTGPSMFPGMMMTSVLIFRILKSIGSSINLVTVCVATGPIFSILSCYAAYKIALTATYNRSSAILSALFVCINPSYVTRSTAGSYDYESISIALILICIGFWMSALESGSITDSLLCAIFSSFLIASWGGYIFLINSIAITVFGLICIGKFTLNQYIVYATYFVVVTCASLCIPFVGLKALHSSEHIFFVGTYILCNFWVLRQYLHNKTKLKICLQYTIPVVVAVLGIIYTILFQMGITSWSGRSLTFLIPGYAHKYVHIIASIAEHQPGVWNTYLNEMHASLFFSPLGLWLCLRQFSYPRYCLSLFTVLAIYFSATMVRINLILAPILAVLYGIVAGELLCWSLPPFFYNIKINFTCKIRNFLVATTVIVSAILYICHSSFFASETSSWPSFVLRSESTLHKERYYYFDDYREGYNWLRLNTPRHARILSWWDYGYQISRMSERTTIVDNNTRNITHIAHIGKILASTEEEAYPILQYLDADYILVIFGGYIKYFGDDLSKLIWPIRIASEYYPELSEELFFSPSKTQRYTTTSMLAESVVYKASTYRLSELTGGVDNVRMEKNPRPIKLKHMKEVFTSKNMLVRIYQVLPLSGPYKDGLRSTMKTRHFDANVAQ